MSLTARHPPLRLEPEMRHQAGPASKARPLS